MKTINLLKKLSLISFSLIILKGSMIAFPFLIYLILNVFCLGTISQMITSIIGICGLIIIIKQMREEATNKRLFMEFVALIMLLIPLIERLTSVQINLFYYLSFEIPIITFLILYLSSLLLLLKKIIEERIK